MNESIYDIPFPREHKELLVRLVELARKCNVLSMLYLVNKPNDPPYALHVAVDAENGFDFSMMEDPAPGFEALGLIKIIDEHHIFLRPQIFTWADYEKKTPFGKWWTRNPNFVRDLMIVFSFIVTLAFTLLQLLNLITPP